MVEVFWTTTASSTFFCCLTFIHYICAVHGELDSISRVSDEENLTDTNSTFNSNNFPTPITFENFVSNESDFESLVISSSASSTDTSNHSRKLNALWNNNDDEEISPKPTAVSSSTETFVTSSSSLGTTHSSSTVSTKSAPTNKLTTTMSFIDLNESCVALKCQHDSRCQFGEKFVYCNCGILYTGYNCANAFPMYLIIALCVCSAIILTFGITSFVCFIKSKKKKVAPHVNGASHKDHRDKTIIPENDLYKVDESIYSEPSDFYGGESVKGNPIATNTLPKIPRIGLAKVNLETRDSSNSTYRTFHPRRNESQSNQDQI